MQQNPLKFLSVFKIPWVNYDESSGKCVLDEAHKRLYSFLCLLCKMIAFLNFSGSQRGFSYLFKETTVCFGTLPTKSL